MPEGRLSEGSRCDCDSQYLVTGIPRVLAFHIQITHRCSGLGYVSPRLFTFHDSTMRSIRAVWIPEEANYKVVGNRKRISGYHNHPHSLK